MRRGQNTGGALWRVALSWTLVVGVTAAYLAVFLRLPYLSDDLWYIWQTGCGGQSLTASDGSQFFPAWSIGGFADCVRTHWLHDNVRLANVSFAAMLALPKVLINIVEAVMVAASLWLMCRLGGLTMRRTVGVAWVCVAFVVALPWFNDQWTPCYVFNYMGGTLLALIAALIFLRGKSSATPAAVAGLLCGLWHEGFGVPVLAGALAVAVLWRRRYGTCASWSMIMGLAAGTVFLLCAPKALMRMGDAGSGPLWMWMIRTLKYNVPMMVFLALTLAVMLRARTRRAADMPRIVFLAVGALASYGIHCVTHFNVQISWCADVLSLAGIVLCVNTLTEHRHLSPSLRTTTAVATVLAVAAVAVHLTAVVRAAAVTRSLVATAAAALQNNPSGETFMSFPREEDWPSLTLNHVHDNTFTRPWQLITFSTYGTADYFMPVAPELAYALPDSGETMPGTPGLRQLKGQLFIPADSLPNADTKRPTMVDASVTFALSTALSNADVAGVMPRKLTRTRYVTLIPFTSRADNRRYLYAIVNDLRLLRYYGPVSAVTFAAR